MGKKGKTTCGKVGEAHPKENLVERQTGAALLPQQRRVDCTYKLFAPATKAQPETQLVDRFNII